MKIYKHTGAGHYIGSCVIVVAVQKRTANSVIRRYLNSNGLKDEKLNVEEVQFADGSIVHSVNGDY